MNNKSNEIWKNESHYNNWELRKHRFTIEMRPVIFQYLGITPDSYVLDSGCGTGVFARYIAGGLKNGKVVGFDISENLIKYGNDRISEEDLTATAGLIVADGFELPLDDNTFDAVTNYTYLGVLSDPVAGLKEMIRVCKAGGTVSSICPCRSVNWKGEYPLDFRDRLSELYDRQEEIYKKHIQQQMLTDMYFQSTEWHTLRYPKMFDICGLKDIHIYPFGAGFSCNDSRWPREYRKFQIDTGISEEIRWINERSGISKFEDCGFTKKDFTELLDLLERKREYLIENIDTDRSFEWNAALNIIVTGTK